jgi:hypothetical protein
MAPLGEKRRTSTSSERIFRTHSPGEFMLARSHRALMVALVFAPMAAWAQHGGEAPRDTRAPRDAAQFNFMVGAWSLEVKPKATSLAARIHGAPRMQGTWKAWRALEGWGIEDELRITDASGNPVALTHFVRVFDPSSRRWNVSALDVYRAKFTASTAQLQGEQILTSTQNVVVDGKPALSRARITDMTPNGFRYHQDRSTDGGRSWTEDVVLIDAKRTAAVAPR